jgi:hypothetical protein
MSFVKFILPGIILVSQMLFAQAPIVQPEMHMVARLEPSDLTRELLSQQFIAYESLEYVELFDLTGDGFGEGDVIIVQPGRSSHILRSLSAGLRQDLKQWGFAAHRELRAPVDVSPAELRETGHSITAMLADILEVSRSNMGNGKFEMALDADEEGILFRVWDYYPDSLYQRPDQNLAYNRSAGRIVDIVEIFHQDTTYIVDSILHDLLIIESQVVDTVYIDQDKK